MLLDNFLNLHLFYDIDSRGLTEKYSIW